MNSTPLALPTGYSLLRSLSTSSPVCLCREDATSRLVVIKMAQTGKEAEFKRELEALISLEHFPHSPRLLFAFSQPRLLAGIQYFPGKNLTQFLSHPSIEFRRRLAQALQAALGQLHGKFNRAHGDLSPRNILVNLQQGSDEPQISLIDWEFSQSLLCQDTDTYKSFRGTPGYSPASIKPDVAQRDIDALAACFGYLNLDKLGPPMIPSQGKWGIFRKWNRRQI